MTIARAAILLVLFGGIALCTVHLRAEQVRATARIQKLEDRRVQLRQLSWSYQLEAARLKSPDRIAERVERLRLQVGAPYQHAFERQDAGLASVGWGGTDGAQR